MKRGHFITVIAAILMFMAAIPVFGQEEDGCTDLPSGKKINDESGKIV